MSPAGKIRPLIPYLRQSRKREQTISIEEQRRDIRRWAEGAGVKLAAEVVEQNVSGSKSWRARGIGHAVELCEAGKASGIVVAYQDRLTRENSIGTAEVWEALGKAGARLVCLDNGIDTATGDHELLFTIMGGLAREQWKRHRGNWERARRNAIERGVHVGPTPAGYRRTQAAHPETGELLFTSRGEPVPGPLEPNEHADAVREAFELRAGGASWTRVARSLTEAGVPNREGKPWSLKAAEKLTRNRVYLGEIRSGEFAQRDAHEPLVRLALFERVQANREVRGPNKNSQPGLLSGLLRCASCGNRMTQDWNTRNGTRTNFYTCKNGGACTARASVTHARVEPYVERLALEHLGAADYGKTTRGPNVVQLEEALRLAEAEVAAYLLHARPTLPGFAAGLAKLEAEVEAARTTLGESEGEESWVFLSETETVETYRRMELADKRRVLAALVEHATVTPGRASIEERVEVTLAERPRVTRPEWLREPV